VATPVIGESGAAVAVPAQRGAVALPEAVGRLRQAAGTPPGRLRLAGAVLAALALLFGLVAAWQASGRAEAAGQVASHSGPLSQDAAEIYRSLADADTTAAGGFLLAGDEPAAVRQRYEQDLATASRLLAQAAARTTASSDAQHWVSELNQQLPRYAGLVETARADARQGLPLGGAYLRHASRLMQDEILPNAQKLTDAESRQLTADYDDAKSYPWVALLLGLLALGALARYQVLLFRRTNRVFNRGLVAASAAMLVAVGWLAVGTVSNGADLSGSWSRGARPLHDLNQARIEALQAHAAENLNLVARGGSEAYTARWSEVMKDLAGPTRRPYSLSWAAAVAPASASEPMLAAQQQFATWQARHQAAADKEGAGDYDGAQRATLSPGGTDTAEAAFAAMDRELALAAEREKAEFKAATGGVAGSFDVLAVGAGVLAVLAAAGTVRGIGRRLAEYR